MRSTVTFKSKVGNDFEAQVNPDSMTNIMVIVVYLYEFFRL